MQHPSPPHLPASLQSPSSSSRFSGLWGEAEAVAGWLERSAELAEAPPSEAVPELGGRNCHMPNALTTPLQVCAWRGGVGRSASFSATITRPVQYGSGGTSEQCGAVPTLRDDLSAACVAAGCAAHRDGDEGRGICYCSDQGHSELVESIGIVQARRGRQYRSVPGPSWRSGQDSGAAGKQGTRAATLVHIGGAAGTARGRLLRQQGGVRRGLPGGVAGARGGPGALAAAVPTDGGASGRGRGSLQKQGRLEQGGMVHRIYNSGVSK